MRGRVDSCYLHTIDQKLFYDAGSHEFTVGATLTGVTSEATGTIKSVTLSSGSWAGGTAGGYVVLSNVTGTFQNNETITDDEDTPGTALANGTQADYKDAYGKKTQTASTTATSCRFVNLQSAQGDLEDGWNGHIPSVILPAGTTLFVNQLITSTVTGFSGTYEIQWPPVYYRNGVAAVHHITCGIKEVGI